MYIGAIADDLTGATDLALMLSRGGMRVVQLVGTPRGPIDAESVDAVVVALKSRTIPAADAVAQSLDSARALLAAGAAQLFFKYCSTFDSTDEGNIGPVTDALLDLLGESRTIACPAFPANGRTVFKGHLFVGDVLLSESSMRNHPLTPMRDPNLVRVLQRQTRRPVSLVTHETVAMGGERLDKAFDALDGIAIVDAVDETDLRRIGRAARGLRLVTGGSGVAMGLPANFDVQDRSTQGTPAPAAAGASVVLAGSCSTATRRQVEVARAAGMPALKLDPQAIAEGRMTVAETVEFARAAADDGQIPLVFSSDDPAAVAVVQQRLGRAAAGELVEHFLGAVARQLADAGFTRFLVAGGETSGAVVAALDIDAVGIGPEIDPGVPWTSTRGERPLALALKSGNFGSDDIFLKAWRLLA